MYLSFALTLYINIYVYTYSLVCLNVSVCWALSSLNLCVYRARLRLHVCVYRAVLRMHVRIVYVVMYDPQHVYVCIYSETSSRVHSFKRGL